MIIELRYFKQSQVVRTTIRTENGAISSLTLTREHLQHNKLIDFDGLEKLLTENLSVK